jgi:tetratricopeptide (TPR) repeat protein
LPFSNDGAVLALAKIAEAQHDFKTAIGLAESVGNAEALGLVITAKLAMGQVAEATALAEELVDQYPSLGSLTLKALAHEAQGQYELALGRFSAGDRRRRARQPRRFSPDPRVFGSVLRSAGRL